MEGDVVDVLLMNGSRLEVSIEKVAVLHELERSRHYATAVLPVDGCFRNKDGVFGKKEAETLLGQ
jgi:hypothetical protein